WSISGIPTGMYTVNVSKPGYGLLRWFAVPVFGGGTNYVAPSYLPPVPMDSVLLDAADTILLGQNRNIKITGHSTHSLHCVYFVDFAPDVKPGDSHLVVGYPDGLGTTQHETYFEINDLLRQGARSGNKIYISACGVGGPTSPGGSYVDPRD